MSDKKLHDEIPATANDPSVQSSKGDLIPPVPSTGTPDAAWENASPHGDRSLSCADCGWSVSGKTEEEVLGYMRAHARQVHGKSEFTSAELESARRAIHKRAA